jgi:hypothetical protein
MSNEFVGEGSQAFAEEQRGDPLQGTPLLDSAVNGWS